MSYGDIAVNQIQIQNLEGLMLPVGEAGDGYAGIIQKKMPRISKRSPGQRGEEFDGGFEKWEEWRLRNQNREIKQKSVGRKANLFLFISF